MDNKGTDKQKLLIKILIPILMAVALTIIGVAKRHPTPTPISEQARNITDFVLEATSIDLNALKEYNLPIIIDFGANSCIPCKEMAPVLKTLNAEMQSKAIIKFVDMWKNGDAARDFPVQMIPTQVFFNADSTPYVPSDNIEIKFDIIRYKDSGEHAFTVHQGGLTGKEMRTILADMGVAE